LRLEPHDVGLCFAQLSVKLLDGGIAPGECCLIITRRNRAFRFSRSLLKLVLADSLLELAQRLLVCGPLPLEGSESMGQAKNQTQRRNEGNTKSQHKSKL
jgi:hypothetical protein